MLMTKAYRVKRTSTAASSVALTPIKPEAIHAPETAVVASLLSL